MNYLDSIVDALNNLNGEAHINDICTYIETQNTLDYLISNKKWRNQVSNSITTHSSDSFSFKYGDDVFYTPKYNSGYWGLRGYKTASIATDEVAIEDEARYPEGARKSVLVNSYERNIKAREKCIEYYGAKCVVCGFSFQEVYGNEFASIIHVHHIKPLCEIKESYQVDPIKDLRPVCPNCHQIIHSQKPSLLIEELEKRVNCKKLHHCRPY